MGSRVAIVTRQLPHYRVAFYEGLREWLADRDIELVLVYGDASEADRTKGDLVEIAWGRSVPNRIVTVRGRDLYWQRVVGHIAQCDLVVVEQASRLLVNYWLQLRQLVRRPKVAFWGHGRHFGATDENRFAEAVKRAVSTRVHWWFAYTDLTRDVVTDLGFDPHRITVVQNSLDTTTLRRQAESLTEADLEVTRAELGVGGPNVCTYCGGMYEDKHLPFLLRSAERIRAEIPDFQLVFVGSGPLRHLAQDAAKRREWIADAGPRFGADKAAVFGLSRLVLNPGLVGLSVLDSFVLGTPMVTTDLPGHPPEISYLDSPRNGVKTSHDIGAFSSAVVDLLNDDARYDLVRANALAAGELYSVEEMVERFGDGIIEALAEM